MLACTLSAQQIIHVNKAPGSAYTTIQAGIDAALPGDTVLVADAIYYEQVTINNKKPLVVASHFIMDGDSTHLTGTIIDGSNLEAPNQSVVIISNVDTTVVLAGFTIQNGKGLFSGNALRGGGIRLQNSGAKIINNRIINNVLNGGAGPEGMNCNAMGAGIYSITPSSSWVVMTDNLIIGNICKSNLEDAFGSGGYIRDDLRFSNNIVKGNYAIATGAATAEGGGFCVDGTSLVIVDCIVNDNSFCNNISQSESYCDGAGFITVRARNIILRNEFRQNTCAPDSTAINGVGAGLTLINGAATGTNIIKNNLFNSNMSKTGAGIYVSFETPDNVYIENNTFIGNTAMYGGALYCRNGLTTLINNVFNENTALFSNGFGGAIHLARIGTPITMAWLINNTFAGNRSDLYGGAVSSNNCNSIMLNNIFWNNQSPEGGDISAMQGEAFVAHSNIDTTKISGTINIFEGNMLMDPLFCDTTWCLYPESWSPCLNRGASYYVFAENDTVFAPETDMLFNARPIEGVYDMGAYERDSSGVNVKEVEGISRLSLFPNPVSGIIKLQYTLERSLQVSIAVYDIPGNCMFTNQFSQEAGKHEVAVPMQSLAKGIYLISLQIEGRAVTRKVVKF